jgi:hypothetical protein
LFSRRRIAILVLLLATLLGLASVALVWQWKAPPLVQRRLEQALGRRVTVASVGLTWRFEIVARDIDIAGAPPFDSKAVARIDRAIVRLRGPGGLLSPSEVLVDGMEIDYLASAEGDNLRGLSVARRSAAAAAPRSEKAALPRISVRNGRLRGSLVFAHAPRLAIRAPEVEIVRDAKGRVQAKLNRLVVDAEGLASLHASSIRLDFSGRQAAQVPAWQVSGTGVGLDIPGGGTLVDNLALDGQSSASASSFELRSNESPEPHVLATVAWSAQSAELVTKLHGLPLRALGTLAGGRALGLEAAKAQLQARVAVDRAALHANFEVDGKLSAIDVLHPAIDSTPWRGQAAAFSGRGQADLAAGRVDLDEATLKALGATVKMKGSVEDLRAPRGSLTVATPTHEPVSCAALLFGQPEPVQRALAGLDLQGNLGFSISLNFDASAWQDLRLDVAVDPICSVKSDASVLADLLPVLRKPKTAQPASGAQLPLGTYHPDFVPLSQMPVHLPLAFITSEDSKFFHHQGFDTDMIRNALAQDLGNQSFDRGASTITQQLAKNLFLSHRRTLARKLEEAVLTWRLQKLLSKDRVLELYLNVIELGPGIRGVKQAARRYFGKDVGELVPLESAHLAALTPNPHVLARRFRDGEVDEGWQQRLVDLLGMMKRHHRLSPEELATARTSKLELRDLGRDPTFHRN